MLPAPPSPPPPLSSRNTLHSLCYGQFDKNLPARSSTSVARDVGSGIKVALFVRQTIDPRSRWNSMYTDIRCKTRCIKYLNYAGPCCVPGWSLVFPPALPLGSWTSEGISWDLTVTLFVWLSRPLDFFFERVGYWKSLSRNAAMFRLNSDP